VIDISLFFAVWQNCLTHAFVTHGFDKLQLKRKKKTLKKLKEIS
jgi:hypothetical protein